MLDLDQVNADADAHEARMKSPLWADDDDDESWMPPPVTDPRHPVDPVSAAPAMDSPEILHRLDALHQQLATVVASVAALRLDRSPATEFPAWLQAAVGNPQTYDAPDAARESVCVRVLPVIYTRLRQVQSRLGLRTTAGTWECLLRLGLAAAERLPEP
jgi:hypothetical protein